VLSLDERHALLEEYKGLLEEPNFSFEKKSSIIRNKEEFE
jgi:hypothetical protein